MGRPRSYCNHCYFAGPHQVTCPVDHNDFSMLGATYYRCGVHAAFHGIVLSQHTRQPACGDCALLFYQYPTYSKGNAVQVDERMMGVVPTLVMGRPSDVTLSDDVVWDIPRLDETYTNLATDLVPHRSKDKYYSLKFRTFWGTDAVQPCSLSIDRDGYFGVLEHIDSDGDFFKIARNWSCVIQSIQVLHKDVRWVLASIYTLASYALWMNPGDEKLVELSQWLCVLYKMASKLLTYYKVPASCPIDHSPTAGRSFQRPTAVTVEEMQENESETV